MKIRSGDQKEAAVATFRRAASVRDVPEGQGIAVEIEGKRIALFNVEGEFRAIGAVCGLHRAPLERGVIHEGALQCPWHGVPFDVDRGICSAFPTAPSAITYPVKIEGDDLLVAV